MVCSTKKVCSICSREITTNNFAKHEISCKGIPLVKKIRGIDFDPGWGYAAGVRKAWNAGLTATSDIRVLRNSESIKKSAATNPFHGKCPDPEKETIRREKISVKAKELGFGGYRSNAGRSKKFKVFDSFGKQTTLQSTYEYATFEILCELGITWVRPKALKYDGKNYFADFYLPDFDVWLDPKNDYKAKCDAEKIALVIEQNNIKLFVLLQHQITKEYITRIIQ
jgi:hypothetical protein